MIIYLSKIIIDSLFCIYIIRYFCVSGCMADLNNDIRLAVDSGKAEFGINRVTRAIMENKAKLIIIASKNKGDRLSDVLHLAKASNINAQVFDGTPVSLGIVCGLPFSVSVLSITDPGNSNILNETY